MILGCLGGTLGWSNIILVLELAEVGVLCLLSPFSKELGGLNIYKFIYLSIFVQLVSRVELG